MRRRIACFGSLVLALACGWAAEAGEPAAVRPNILWLTSEDNNHASLGCYGNDLARTPNLDALAQQGIVFENCYAPPVCAPARFTLATGMSPTMCGPAQHHRAAGRLPKGVGGFPADLREAGYYTSNDVKTDYNSRLPVKSLWDHNRAGADWRQRRNKQPFFSVVNHTMCHESCLFAPRVLTVGRMDPDRVRVPPYLPDTPEIRKSIAQAMDCVAEMDRQCGEKLRQLEAGGLAGDTIVFYFGDNGGVIPRSKRFLHESGVHVPLIVYFPPKWQHLAPAAPGSRVRELVHFIDFAPTVLSLAGVDIPSHMGGRAFAGTARRPAPDQVFCSRDRTDEGYDMARCAVDERFLYIRNFRPDIAYGQHLGYAFQSPAYQSWKSMAEQGRLTPATSRLWGEKPREELYDKLTDPDNMVNLADQPEFAGGPDCGGRGASPFGRGRPGDPNPAPLAGPRPGQRPQGAGLECRPADGSGGRAAGTGDPGACRSRAPARGRRRHAGIIRPDLRRTPAPDLGQTPVALQDPAGTQAISEQPPMTETIP